MIRKLPLVSGAVLAFLLVALPLPRSHAALVGWWTFDEGVGTTAADTSPDGATHAAVLENGASFIGSGKFGGAVTLDGVNDIVRISDHPDFEFDQNTSFTLAFWFRTTWNFPNTRGFIGKGYELSPHVAGYFLMRAGGDEIPEFDSRQTSSSTPRIKFDSTMSSGTLNDGSWHHIVAVKDVAGGQVRIYTDNGAPATRAITASEGDWAMGVNSRDLIIGQYASRWTQGDFDDVGIWNEALSAVEIADIFQNGIAAVAAPTDSDGDGIPDDWEILHFGNLDETDFGDWEPDGLTNLQEYNKNTDPKDADSDGDGLEDGPEFNIHGTDPALADTDADGLNDGAEINTHGTDPLLADSDGDGLNDGAEVTIHSTDPLASDSDGDGFSDGVEIAGRSDPNDFESTPDLTDFDDVLINEFMSSNDSELADEDGDFSDWIEIWNPNDVLPVPITNWHLTDDPNDLTKWTLPAINLSPNAFLVVFASGKDRTVAGAELHTSFQLNKAGGSYLALTRPDGVGGTEIVTAFSPYAKQEVDVSFGFYGDTPPLSSGYFTNPTPGAANDQSAVQGFVADTTFSIDRGFYSSTQNVVITSATPGASIIYTTDSTLPRESPLNGTRVNAPNANTSPSAALNISSTTVLRAMAVKADFEPTNIDTQTYIFVNDVLQQGTPSEPFSNWGEHGPDWEMDSSVVNHANLNSRCLGDDLMEIPTLSVALPFADMWGSGGIYISGEGVERNCSIEYLNPDGDPADPNTKKGFQVDGTVQIVGGSSTGRWKSNHLSMRVKFTNGDLREDIFDKEWIPFGDQATNRFDTLVLDARLNNVWNHRSSSDQRRKGQYVRDQYVADLQNALGGAAPHGRHMHVYIAGIYWGMHTIHERPDDNFAAEYFGGDNDDYDVVKHSGSTVVNGSNATYNAMANLLDANLSSQTNFEAAAAKLDMVDFAKYMIVNYFCGNTDWDRHNWYASFNRVQPGAKWHFHSWDAEHVLKNNGDNETDTNNSNKPTGFQYQLMGSPEYKLIFADIVRREFFNGGHMTPANAAAHYQDRINIINEAIRAESARWGDTMRPGNPYLRGVEWQTELSRILNSYFPGRTNTVLNQFKSRGWYPGTDAPNFSLHGGGVPSNFSLTITSPGGGTIYYTLDGSDPRQAFTSTPVGTVYSGPVTLSSTGLLKARVRSGGGEWSAMTSALFVVGTVVADSSNLVVSEIHYRPASPSPGELAAGFGDRGEFEFLELLNVGTSAIDLTQVRFTMGIDFDFALHSSIADLLPGGRIVIVENALAFVMRYGSGIPIAGEFQNGTQLANNGETLALINLALAPGSQSVQSFAYGDDAPWPEAADGNGFSLTLDCPQDNPDPSQASSWRSSVAIGGSPGTDDGVSLATWLASYGLGLGSELTDPDHDQLTVLIEYALGGSPASNDVNLHPGITLQELSVGGLVDTYAVMTFTRNNAAEGVTITPEASQDLVSWQEITEVLTYDASGQAGLDLISVRVPNPISSDTRLFVRLRVETK